jgi:hypothetical protein
MRTHLLSHTFIVLALASTPLMAADDEAHQDASSSQPEAMQMTPEEAALLENMAAEEAAMAEEMGSDEVAPAEEMAAGEAAAAEEMVAEEAAPAEEMAAEETTAAEEMPAEESVETSTVTSGTVIDRRGPAAPVPSIDMPVRGMHMKQVEQTYGKPLGISPPVGDPPITRWDYPGFAVYFEYSYVIQSVEKR